MTLNNANIFFSTTWEIDQLTNTSVVSVGSGTSTLYTTTSASPVLFEVQFKPSGSSVWYMPGQNSTDGTLANQFVFYSYFTSGEVLIHTTTGGTARYFIWSDTVNH